MIKAALLSTLCLVGTQVSYAVSVQPDRFDGHTKIVAVTHGPDNVPQLMLFASVKDHKLQIVSLSIQSSSKEWKYLRCHSVKWLIDGKPVDLGIPEHQGDVSLGGVTESVTFPFSMAKLNLLAKAEKIEFKICNDEITLDDTDVIEISNFKTAILEATKK